jgi:Ca2+-binding RTX toxin-like protein
MLMFESLEMRLLMAVSVSLDKGLLLVNGSSGPDQITVELAEGVLSVKINKLGFTAPMEDVNKITIKADTGNDRVVFGEGIAIGAQVYGGPGNDYLSGGTTSNKLCGEEGNDTLAGGVGKDQLVGGGGIDTADYSLRGEPLHISLDGKPNDGALPESTGTAKGEQDNVMADVENIVGGSGNDQITGSGKPDTLRGGAGDDTLIGLGGNDLLVGGAGADSIEGGVGDDVLMAIDLSAGDVLDGGDGFDTAALDSVLGVMDTLSDIESDASVLET